MEWAVKMLVEQQSCYMRKERTEQYLVQLKQAVGLQHPLVTRVCCLSDTEDIWCGHRLSHDYSLDRKIHDHRRQLLGLVPEHQLRCRHHTTSPL